MTGIGVTKVFKADLRRLPLAQHGKALEWLWRSTAIRTNLFERELARRVLFVGMTRARDRLVITWSGRPSPFLGPVLDRPRRAPA